MPRNLFVFLFLSRKILSVSTPFFVVVAKVDLTLVSNLMCALFSFFFLNHPCWLLLWWVLQHIFIGFFFFNHRLIGIWPAGLKPYQSLCRGSWRVFISNIYLPEVLRVKIESVLSFWVRAVCVMRTCIRVLGAVQPLVHLFGEIFMVAVKVEKLYSSGWSPWMCFFHQF